MIQFDLPKEKSSIIKVFGIGGGGSNAVNYMYSQGIQGVNYVICNTDNQALETSPVPNKIQLGSSISQGLGAGSKPEVGREATEEAIDQLEEILQSNTKMAFITAGMGGGTGTGGAPVVARIAKDMGILTVAIVTMPFAFEGKKRRLQAEAGIDALRSEVDALLIISNDRLRQIHGNLKVSEAFFKADDILATAAKGIAEIITVTGYINVDFKDVETIMRDSGVALMGTGMASGENRAVKAVEAAMNSPLLNDNDIRGAKNVLLNITSGTDEISMDEMGEITDFVQDAIGIEPEKVIMGLSENTSLTENVSVTLIATGFESNKERQEKEERVKRVVHTLGKEEKNSEIEKEVVAEEPEKEEPTMPFLMTEQLDAAPEPVKPEEVKEQPQFLFDFSAESATEKQEDITEFELKQTNTAEDLQQPKTESNAEPVSDAFHLSNNHIQDVGEYQRKHADRLKRLQSFSLKFKTNDEVEKLENEPAYVRKQVELEEAPASDQSEVSRFSLGENEEGIVELKDNTYLHGNVD